MPQKVILFNGPPSCGKDTAALALFHRGPTPGGFPVFDRMSMPIKRALASTIGLNIDWKGNVEHWEQRKEEVIPGFGYSYRQWQIDFSEKFMKPLYGEDIFVKLFISRSKKQSIDALILVPDCGFDIEYFTLGEHFGKENVLLVKIWREGTSFAGDSRGYLKAGSNFGFNFVDDGDIRDNVAHISNNGTKKEFEAKVLTLVKEWLSNAKL